MPLRIRTVQTVVDIAGPWWLSTESCRRTVVHARTPSAAIDSRKRSGGSSFVAVMKAADLREFNHGAGIRRLNRSRLWRILVQGQMRSRVLVIVEIRSQDSAK